MQITHYAELSWPEVERLPRDVPVILPVGAGEEEVASISRRLGGGRVVVLPSVPYGFPRRDSDPLGALAIGAGLFRRVLLGILREVRAQGFDRLAILDPQRACRSLRLPGIRVFPGTPPPPSPKARLGDLDERVVLISVGHTEQHGLHLPLCTDTVIVQAIADGLAAADPTRLVCLPAWPYGVSTHTRQYPGTLNLGGRLFEDFFLAVVRRLVQLGARRIFFSNAHGGNHSYLVNVVKSAGERWPGAFVATEFLHTTGPALERLRASRRGGMGHACELETSYMLHLRPDLVEMSRAVVETEFLATPNYYMDWIEGGRLIANPPWSDDTRSGAYGDPTAATAEKGRQWLAAAVEEKLQLLEELREQHERRSRRRAGGAAPT